MQKYRRNTVVFRGVKVRYSHLYFLEDGVRYTTTDMDERNMKSVEKAFRKNNVKRTKRGWVLISSIASNPRERKAFIDYMMLKENEYSEFLKHLAQSFENQQK